MEALDGHAKPHGLMRDVVPLRAIDPELPDHGTAPKPRLRLGDDLTAPEMPMTWRSKFEHHLKAQGDWLPPLSTLPDLPDGSVIVGVIDADIPLGHSRLRDASGNSRIAAAWQMGQPTGPDYLPFGNELYQADIDRHLRECKTGSDGRIDQLAFDLRTGTVDMTTRFGRRALAGRSAHGAHVLDVAAGCERSAAADIGKTCVIAVNLPPRAAFGASGEFLDYYMVHALRRIVDLSDAIWVKNHPEPTDGPIGYPTIINLSFGRQAGVKDSRGVFASALSQLIGLRDDSRAPLDIVMPAGNDNLERMYAVANLEPGVDGPGAVAEIDWRIQPEDQSSNYVEILFEAPSEASSPHAPIEIDLSPPGAAPCPRPIPVNARSELGRFAAIYCRMLPADREGNTQLYRLLLCVAPTSRPGGHGACAPSGAWKIRLRNVSDSPVEVDLNIQTDQSILPASTAGRRSYLDSPFYRRFDSGGRPLDTWASELGNDTVARGSEARGPQDPVFDPEANPCVRRHGTINATASSALVVCAGGYRRSDGREAPYSSTGTGVPLSDDGRSAPTAAFPTDDGYAHFGILAAGAADGSVVPMRGTSFAAPQATRLIALRRLSGNTTRSGNEILSDQAEDDESHSGYAGERTIAKTGKGRARLPQPRRVGRM
ncbi:S8 family serine peptidase [Tropicimonas isoalkanivorans]|nr:S8 family serine peptidase [Tropicimonas isoalkanivorans]